jgi:hypothetical protein
MAVVVEYERRWCKRLPDTSEFSKKLDYLTGICGKLQFCCLALGSVNNYAAVREPVLNTAKDMPIEGQEAFLLLVYAIAIMKHQWDIVEAP